MHDGMTRVGLAFHAGMQSRREDAQNNAFGEIHQVRHLHCSRPPLVPGPHHTSFTLSSSRRGVLMTWHISTAKFHFLRSLRNWPLRAHEAQKKTLDARAATPSSGTLGVAGHHVAGCPVKGPRKASITVWVVLTNQYTAVSHHSLVSLNSVFH